MRTLAGLAMAAVLITCLAGCAHSSKSPKSTTTTTAAPSQTTTTTTPVASTALKLWRAHVRTDVTNVLAALTAVSKALPLSSASGLNVACERALVGLKLADQQPQPPGADNQQKWRTVLRRLTLATTNCVADSSGSKPTAYQAVKIRKALRSGIYAGAIELRLLTKPVKAKAKSK